MAPRRGKRKSDTVDLTGSDGDESRTHPSKAIRSEPSNQPESNIDRRFEQILANGFGSQSRQTLNQRIEENKAKPSQKITEPFQSIVPPVQNPRLTPLTQLPEISGVDGLRQNSEQNLAQNGTRPFQNTGLIPPRQPSEVSGVDGLRQNPGQRFGQNTEFFPLSQLPQISGTDEDDAQAADLIQGSQDFDDASFNDYVLYGMSRDHAWSLSKENLNSVR